MLYVRLVKWDPFWVAFVHLPVFSWHFFYRKEEWKAFTSEVQEEWKGALSERWYTRHFCSYLLPDKLKLLNSS